MTINVISTQIDRDITTGPKKVLSNTIKGFDKIDIKYVFNRPIGEYKYNWIHDDQKAIIEAGFIGKPVLVGPNTAVLPRDLPKLRKKLPNGSIYLHPSPWCVEVWRYLGFDEVSLEYWATGIDTDEFGKVDRANKSKILIYFKQRDLKLLEQTREILNSLGLEYTVIHYGYYKESEYKKALEECRFGIWIGCSESQGIGLQEALSTNLPLIVFDAKSIFDTVAVDSKNYFAYKFPKTLKQIKATSAPYFDERCGVKIYEMKKLKEAILHMNENIDKFNPRKYIEENLSLEKSAKRLVSFFDKMDIKDIKSSNYQNISKYLFYIGLIYQKWAWKWAFDKLRKKL